MLFRYHNSSRLCPRCHGHIHLCLRHSIEYGYIGIQFGPVAAGIYYCMRNGYLVFIAYGSIVAAHSASELVKKVCCIFVVDKEAVHLQIDRLYRELALATTDEPIDIRQHIR